MVLLTRRSCFGLAGAVVLASRARAQTAACSPKVTADHLLEPGKWQMSINPTLPPQQFINEAGELQGLNVELARAMAAKMCLEAVFLRMDFPPMIPGLRAGRFDTINTGLFWTEERSKLFYLVPYAQQAVSVVTLPDSKLVLNSFDDLAGHVVASEIATYPERKAKEAAAEMEKRGLKPVEFRGLTTASDTTAALRAGQVDALVTIDETANALEKRGIGKIRLHTLYGSDITFAFRDGVLAAAAAEALTAVKADGVYDELFKKFAMTPLTGTSFAIRGTGPV